MARLIGLLFVMDRLVTSLDCALVILVIRINNLLSSVNSVSLLFFAPFYALFFLLAIPASAVVSRVLRSLSCFLRTVIDSTSDFKKSINSGLLDASGVLEGGCTGCDERVFTMSDFG